MKRVITQICTLLLLVILAIPVYADKVLAEIEYFYSDDGTLIGKAFNGKRVNFEYDLRGQLLAVKDTNWCHSTYLYDRQFVTWKLFSFCISAWQSRLRMVYYLQRWCEKQKRVEVCVLSNDKRE